MTYNHEFILQPRASPLLQQNSAPMNVPVSIQILWSALKNTFL